MTRLTEDDPLNSSEDGSLILTSRGTMLHTHFVAHEGRKITLDEGDWFSYIECSCGLTGVNENGKIEWNEHNFCQRLGKTVYKK